MNPSINFTSKDSNILEFVLSGVDVSFANAVRRTILSDIPCVVFKTIPYEQNKANILHNTTRLNNEILKQRLSCIPICIKDIDIPLNNLILEIDEENKTDTMMVVTTKNFKFKNTNTGEYLPENEMKTIFPPFIPPTGHEEYYIDFCRLRPKITDDIPGEKIKLTCGLSISTAKDDSMFNIVSTCSYGYTLDENKINEELEKNIQKWKNEGKNTKEVEFEAANWKLLEALRYTKPNSFDFIIESIGIYENEEIVYKACKILIDKFEYFKSICENDEVKIVESDNTMPNSFDIILINEDYTIGNVLKYVMYQVYFVEEEILTYCGFTKLHPHDTDSILRIAFNDDTITKKQIQGLLISASDRIIDVYKNIIKSFAQK